MNEEQPSPFRQSVIAEAGKWLVMALATSAASIMFMKKDIEYLQAHTHSTDTRIEKMEDRLQSLQREVWTNGGPHR
jgi:cell division protein FtsL